MVQKIQEERAAVALNIFLKRGPSDDLQDLQKMVTTKIDIRKFTLIQVRDYSYIRERLHEL